MRPFIFSSLLLLVVTWGCADDEPAWTKIKPRAEQIQRLEEKLKNEVCIGDISFWERRYAFWTEMNRRSPTYGRINSNLVRFKLRRGTADYPIKPVLSVEFSYPGIIDLDHRRGKFADGVFNIASDKLTMVSCYDERGDT